MKTMHAVPITKTLDPVRGSAMLYGEGSAPEGAGRVTTATVTEVDGKVLLTVTLTRDDGNGAARFPWLSLHLDPAEAQRLGTDLLFGAHEALRDD